jgi:hypothetical protein
VHEYERRTPDRLADACFAAMLLTLPLVQVGTLKAGGRIVPADALAAITCAALGLRSRTHERVSGMPRIVMWLALIAALGALAASLIGLTLITPDNFYRWPGYSGLLSWLGPPVARTTIETARLLTSMGALLATLALVRDVHTLTRAWTCVAAAALVTAVYAIYAWAASFAPQQLPVLPGTFSYVHLHRAAATFPEPAAYAGFALIGLVATLKCAERTGQRMWYAAGAVQLLAALASLSTLVLAGLAILPLLWWRRLRHSLLVIVLLVFAAGLVAAVMPQRSLRQWVDKPFSAQNSWLDRTTAWNAALGMFRAYPVLGVGVGLYAYNQADFIPVTETVHGGGRINSIALELLAEMGVVAGGCALVIIGLALASSMGRWPGEVDMMAGWTLLVLSAGYYTSRYAFFWVFAALLVAERAIEKARVARVAGP